MKKISSLGHVHAHFSGINFTAKGERSHKVLDKSFFDRLKKSLKKAKNGSMTLICESPDPFKDALKMKNWF